MFDKDEELILSALPPAVQNEIINMYGSARAAPSRIGDTKQVEGYWLETHTIGCREAADELQENWWDSHYSIFQEYREDGISVVFGDVEDGVFITATPLRQEILPQKHWKI